MDIVVHHGALGDFVLVWPVLRGLGGPVWVAAGGGKAKVARRLLGEQVEPAEGDGRDWMVLHVEEGWREVSEAGRERWAKARRVVSFVSDGADAWARNAAKLAPEAQRVYVRPRPPEGWRGHVTAWHRAELARQGLILPPVEVPALAAMDEPMGPVDLGDHVVVHPGSGGVAKCWPAERYERVIEALREAGRRVTVVLGEAERERWPADRVARWEAAYGARVLGSLEELVTLLAGATGYVGNDSGPTHLAGAMGLATLALFGPTDPRRWAPVGEGVNVLAPAAPRPMDWLSVGAVLAASGLCPKMDRP